MIFQIFFVYLRQIKYKQTMKIKKYQNPASPLEIPGGSITQSKVTATLPDPRSGKGNQLAYKFAERIKNKEITLKDVPRSYQNYVQGIVSPGGSLDVSRAITENGVPIAAPIVGSAAAGALGYAMNGLGIGNQVGHMFKVLGNPASAKTTAGAIAATAADAQGVISGMQGLTSSAEKIKSGNYTWGDIPETILSGTVLLPGSSQLTNMKNWGNVAGNALKSRLAKLPDIKQEGKIAYRVIDDAGLNDLVSSGLIRPNQTGPYAHSGVQGGTWFSLDKPATQKHPTILLDGKKVFYRGNYVIEIGEKSPQFPTGTTPGTVNLNYRLGAMEIDPRDPRIRIYDRRKGKYLDSKSYTVNSTSLKADATGYTSPNASYKSLVMENQPIMSSSKGLTLAEKLGIPKSERGKLTQDQIDALTDLYWWKTQGRFKNRFGFNPTTDTFRWSTKLSEAEVPGVKAIIDAGGKPSHMGGPITLSNTFGNFTVWPGKNAKFSANFPIPEGMKWGPGDTTTMLVDSHGHEMKFILTSPKVDAIDNDLPQTIIDMLPNTIDKNIMKRYWSKNREMIRPGTYLSGDNGRSPLGAVAMRKFDSSKSIEPAISDILHFKTALDHTIRQGLSPDSWSTLVRQGSRPGMELRWGSSFQKWNPSAVKNKPIYDAWVRMKNGEITPEEYKKVFDAWSLPQGGRPLEVVRIPSKVQTVTDNNGTVKTITTEPCTYVNIPHPYILYKKQGGKINDTRRIKIIKREQSDA